MTTKFKEGDEVLCIDDSGMNNITLGNKYKVTDKYGRYIAIICDKGRVNYYKDYRFEPIKEKSNMQEKQFHQLEEGKEYRLLHGGEKDHGYIYEIRDGRLFNKIKGRFSLVPFNNKVRFIESITKKFNLSTLEFDVVLGPRQAKIGCQTISKDDLREFYHKLGEFYGF